LLPNFFKFNHLKIGEIAKVTDGEHGSVEFQNSGIKYLTAENVKKGYVDISKIRYVNEEVNQRNVRAAVNPKDILISIKGTLGEVAMAEGWLLPANMNRDVAIMKLKMDSKITAEFVTIFLMGLYGNFQSERCGSGGVQQMITLERLREFFVPILSDNFQTEISNLYHNFLKNRALSKAIYTEAENLLLEELGLKDWQPSQENTAIKTFSASFGTSGRLDAEYYQPKYDEIEKKKKNYSPLSSNREYKNNYYECLGEIGKFTSGSFISDDYYVSKSKRAYIRIKELSFKEPINSKQVIYISKNYVAKNETVVYENEFVIATIGNTIGKINRITKEFDNSFISNNTSKYKLFDNSINPFYFELMLRSPVVQMQIEREFTQTAQPKISDDSLRNIIVPLIEEQTQQTIAEKIQQSFQLKKQSEHLLETAKRAVEIAIEQNETTALEYINNQTLSSQTDKTTCLGETNES